MAIKSFLVGSLLSIAIVFANADPFPDANPRTAITTLVTRVAPPPSPTGSSPIVSAAVHCEGECDKVKAESSSYLPRPARTCVREALVALANWRLRCDQGGVPPTKCWTRAPSVERCCGKWVDVNDEQYKDYPPVRTRQEVQTGQTSWEWRWNPKMDKKGHREVILQTVDEYHADKTECKRWRAENDFVFLAFMQHLEEYGICDADSSGKALDSTVPRYDPEGGGYYDNGNPKYPSLQDGPPLGW